MSTRIAIALILVLILTFRLPGYTAPPLNIGGAVAGGGGELLASDGESGPAAADIIRKNPTFAEARDFILKDPTNRNRFVPHQYECRHFATDVDHNAEAAGLRCGFVLLGYERGQHAVVAFETTDQGLIYIEPQTDAALHPEVGGRYQGKEIKEILIAW